MSLISEAAFFGENAHWALENICPNLKTYAKTDENTDPILHMVLRRSEKSLFSLILPDFF